MRDIWTDICRQYRPETSIKQDKTRRYVPCSLPFSLVVADGQATHINTYENTVTVDRWHDLTEIRTGLLFGLFVIALCFYCLFETY